MDGVLPPTCVKKIRDCLHALTKHHVQFGQMRHQAILMELAAARQFGDEKRCPNAAPNIASQVGQAGDIIVLLDREHPCKRAC